MTITTDITDSLQAAHELAAFGYHLVPIAYGGKRPLVRWRDSPSNHRIIDGWFARFGIHNLALHAGKSGVIVLDADSSQAEAWIREHCPATPLMARTPRGGLHAYYRANAEDTAPRTGLFGIHLDVRAGASLIIASPSYSQKHRTHWEWIGHPVRPSELPVLPLGVIHREPLPKPIRADYGHVVPGRHRPIRDVTRWIMEVDSIQGSGGSNQCFKVACRLVDAGLPWDEAWRWLCLWNGRQAHPPWSEAELWHKLRDAFSRP